MKIKFNSISKQNILVSDFQDLKDNNIVEFSDSGIAIIYGPNGTGKTTLADILGNNDNTHFSIEINGEEITNEVPNKIFYNIHDQNGRNIIKGKTEDFLLGDNIRKEFELKKQIDEGFNKLYSTLISSLKSNFSISTKSSPLYTIVKPELKDYISDLANTRSKGKRIDRSDFLSTVNALSTTIIDGVDEYKYQYFVNDFKTKNSIIKSILDLVETDIQINSAIRRIEESEDAIKILEKYDYLENCIICENDIDRISLIEQKKKNKEDTYNSLDEKTSELLDIIIEKIGANDPFNIKQILLDTIKDGDFSRMKILKDDITSFFTVYNQRIINLFSDNLQNTELVSLFIEYEKLIKEKQIFTAEDALFIERFVNDCIDKKIELKRDNDNNLELLLGDKKFLNKNRNELSLSNGEQNFISLAFELLKAKKVENSIIILDDPISSFDSIYKNKIAYSIIKFLNEKKQLILTHNTDLIRLLEHQKPNCYNLFMMNNTEDEVNGFIRVSKNEQRFLLYLHELISFFRNDIKSEVLDEKSFLISTIPFMRGYAQITNKLEIKNELTKLMHGYNDEEVNITKLYNDLFETDIFTKEYTISAIDISDYVIDDLSIINQNNYQ